MFVLPFLTRYFAFLPKQVLGIVPKEGRGESNDITQSMSPNFTKNTFCGRLGRRRKNLRKDIICKCGPGKSGRQCSLHAQKLKIILYFSQSLVLKAIKPVRSVEDYSTFQVCLYITEWKNSISLHTYEFVAFRFPRRWFSGSSVKFVIQ